jgi:hypothetical protein
LDNTTDGGVKQADPGGGREKWLTGIVGGSSQTGTILVYDRLAHDGTFSGTVTTSQAVSFTPPSRYSSGVGNAIFVEVSSAIGSTATTATCAYNDQDNNAATSPAFSIGGTGLQEAQRLIWVPLATGDTGVRNVTDIDLAATTGTAGDLAVVLAHPLAWIPVSGAGLGQVRDFITGLPSIIKVETDACLSFAFLANGTTAPEVWGSLHMVER